MAYSKDEVKEQISEEDVFTLLEYWGAEPRYYRDTIVCLTICHQGDSHKLYYYDNTQLFHCFTHCQPASFDIFQLTQKVENISDLNAAVYWIVNFFNLQHYVDEKNDNAQLEDWKILNKYGKIKEIEDNKKELILPEYDINVIKHYPRPRYLNWERDNISKEICDYAGIHYDPLGGNILIPHFDENNRCIGIRQRTLIKEQEEYGKYKPWKHAGILYNHPLGFSLFGLNWAKENIQKSEVAIVVESEKSVLTYLTYFGLANDICVAVCGSSLSRYQFELLRKYGAKEIVIGFDRDFEQSGSEEWQKVVNKLQGIYDKYSSMVNVSFLFDSQCDQLGYKQSPLEAGKEKFLYLFKNRIVL